MPFLPFRRLARLLLSLLALVVLVVAVANAVVLLGGRSDHDTVADAPRAQVALVLGAQVRSDGSMSTMLADRVRVAAELYRAGKVRKVLASGDHGSEHYDEVDAMRRGLLAAGVPPEDLFTDHAGFDTFDSAFRARKVFKVGSALVVTQRFHLARAVWLARRAGLRADGVVADRHDYGRANTLARVREAFARVKAVGEVATGHQPRYLGEPVPITGDGRTSRG
jgi:SanA protein